MRQRLPGSFVAHPAHGPLPLLLVLLTVVTGMVDAISLLALGRVFIANMTGNVVFLGFALSGTAGFAAAGLFAAIAGFVLGAWTCGTLDFKLSRRRDIHLRNVTLYEAALFGIGLIVVLVAGSPLNATLAVMVVAIGSFAMGLQNAMVRRLAVPDLTTSVVSVTLVALVSDIRRQPVAVAMRRASAVLGILVGAAIGALVTVQVGLAAALGVIIVVLVGISVATAVLGRSPQDWQQRTWTGPKW